jgi:hypothetical protein
VAADGLGAEVIEMATALVELPEVPGSDADREDALRAALDHLALTYHRVRLLSLHGDASTAPPRAEYSAVRARFATAFPRLGFYEAITELSKPHGEAEATTGDALDDLADIAVDLQDVLDRARVNVDDALWHFRFGFETHWGAHLRWLQLYLHGRESQVGRRR